MFHRLCISRDDKAHAVDNEEFNSNANHLLILERVFGSDACKLWKRLLGD